MTDLFSLLSMCQHHPYVLVLFLSLAPYFIICLPLSFVLCNSNYFQMLYLQKFALDKYLDVTSEVAL